jgi:hypothetical protein
MTIEDINMVCMSHRGGMKKVCTEKAWRHVLSMAWRTPFPRSRLPANIEKFNEAIECVIHHIQQQK